MSDIEITSIPEQISRDAKGGGWGWNSTDAPGEYIDASTVDADGVQVELGNGEEVGAVALTWDDVEAIVTRFQVQLQIARDNGWR